MTTSVSFYIIPLPHLRGFTPDELSIADLEVQYIRMICEECCDALSLATLCKHMDVYE
jgi:hypothetical protein